MKKYKRMPVPVQQDLEIVKAKRKALRHMIENYTAELEMAVGDIVDELREVLKYYEVREFAEFDLDKYDIMLNDIDKLIDNSSNLNF